MQIKHEIKCIYFKLFVDIQQNHYNDLEKTTQLKAIVVYPENLNSIYWDSHV